jgi:hypothetical protein
VGGRWLNQPTRLNAPARAFLSPLAEGPYRLSQLTHPEEKYQKTKLSHALACLEASPSPPGEKAATRQDQARKSSADDRGANIFFEQPL